MKFPSPSRLLLPISIACLLAFLAGNSTAESLPYDEPSFGKFDFSKTPELSDYVSDNIFTALMQVVEHPEVDGETRGKAMLLAYHICRPEWKTKVILRDYELRHNKPFSIEYLENPESPGALAPVLESAMLRLFPTENLILPEDEDQPLKYSGTPPSDEGSAAYYLASLHQKLEHWDEAGWVAQTSPEWPEAYRLIPMNAASATGSGFAKRQSLVKGLLVVQLRGAYAGQASQMNASVLPGRIRPMELAFNQEVGPDMKNALERVKEFSARRHKEVPPNMRIEFSFEEQYSLKDGPSASVACALLMDSLWAGNDLESRFAVTGDMQPSGRVDPVGGISGKIRGAAARDCTHVAIPEVNTDALLDILIIEGIEPLTKVQVFTIDTFDDAKALALPAASRTEDINKSLELFSTVANVLERSNFAEATLRNPQVQDRLREVMDLTPNHASAKILLLKAIGREPERLTVQGSLEAIDRAVLPLLQGLRETNFGQNGRASGGLMETDTFADTVYNLRRIRHKLDERTWKCVDAMADFSALLRKLKNEPPESVRLYNQLVSQVNAAGDNIDREYEYLFRTLQLEQRAEEAKRRAEREKAEGSETE